MSERVLIAIGRLLDESRGSTLEPVVVELVDAIAADTTAVELRQEVAHLEAELAARRLGDLRRAERDLDLNLSQIEAVADATDELLAACSRFAPYASAHEGLAVVREEYLELEQEVFHGDARGPAGRTEAIQLAAVSLRYASEIAMRS